MHRSGTSVTASWLQRCGLKVHNGDFWGPGPGNPKGHFEDKDFVKLHESVLQAHLPSSQGWKVTHKSDFVFNEKSDVNQALNLVNVRNSKYDQWGWKDPRTSLFLSQWKKIIPSLKTLVLWRPCEQVVRSLINRSRISKNSVMKVGTIESIKLWNTYNTLLLDYRSRYPQDSLFYPLESLIVNDRHVLNSINDNFGTNLIYHPISDVYDSELLKHDHLPFLIRIICRFLGSEKIHRKLDAVSDN